MVCQRVRPGNMHPLGQHQNYNFQFNVQTDRYEYKLCAFCNLRVKLMTMEEVGQERGWNNQCINEDMFKLW